MLKTLLHRPIAVSMTLIAIVAVGVLSMMYIPVSLMPQIDVPIITVQCVKAGASVSEVEQQMVTPLRQQLSQVAGLKDIESQSRIDAGTITMTFEPGTDMDLLFIEVNEKIDRAMNHLPKDLNRPKVIKASAMDIPAFYIDVKAANANYSNTKNSKVARDSSTKIEGVNNKNMQVAQLSNLITNVIAKRIEQLPQVAMVDISGTVRSEILCVPDMERLESMGMNVGQIENAIKDNNIILGTLSVVSGIYRYTIHFDSQILTKEDIENIYIRHQGRLLQLKDVCHVEEKAAVRNGIVKHDGEDAISIAVIKQNDAQMEDLQHSIKILIDDMREEYPNIDFSITRDQTQLLTYSISNLEWNLLIAAVLACAILFLFNRSWKTPLLIIISIPLSLILTLLCFYVLGISLNIISLSGLILGVGMIVDNSIIVIDNMKGYVCSANDGNEIRFDDFIVSKVKEVFFPMLSSVLTTCSVFLPLIFLSGTAGALFYDQAMGVTIALFASLFVASIAVPVYYFAIFKKKPDSANTSSSVQKHISLKSTFTVIEKYTIRNGGLCIGVFFVAIVLTAVTFLFIKKERMPAVAHDDMLVNIDWNAGISAEENERRVNEILKEVESHVVTSTSMIGVQEFVLSHTKDITGSEAVIYVKGRSEEGIDSIKRELDCWLDVHHPEAKADYEISGNIFDMIFQTDKPDLEIRLSRNEGGRPNVKAAEAYADTLRRLFKVVDMQKVPTEENLLYVANAEMMAYHNVSYSQLYSRLKEMTGSSLVCEIASGAQNVPVMVGTDMKKNADEILGCFVTNNDGIDVPIAYLVDVEKVHNFKRLYAGSEGEYYPIRIDKIGDSNAEAIMHKCSEMKSLRSVFHGNYFDSRDMILELSVVLLVSVLLLYFILAAQFESLLQPLIILSEVVLDVSVVLLVLWLLDESLNIMSMIGMVVMSGIIINDSILKVDTINRMLKKKESRISLDTAGLRFWKKSNDTLEDGAHSIRNYRLIKAIMTAGQRRLKPIVMTSLTTILSLIPFLHRGDIGSALQYPLSLSLIVGMAIGTIVSLFFVPLVYFLIYRKKA